MDNQEPTVDELVGTERNVVDTANDICTDCDNVDGGKISRMTAIKWTIGSIMAGFGIIASIKNSRALESTYYCGKCTLTAKCGSCIAGSSFGRKRYVYSAVDYFNGGCKGFCYTQCISC